MAKRSFEVMTKKSSKKNTAKRMNQIMIFLEQFACGNLDIKLQHSKDRDEIDGVMVGLNMIVEEIKSNYIKDAYVQDRLSNLNIILESYGKQDFKRKLKLTNDNNIFDLIDKRINDLGNQLESYKIKNEKMVSELTNKYNELMQFNYIVSHNLRSPITSILGLATIINMPNFSMEEKYKCLEHIQASAIKMDELVKELSTILATRTTLNTKKGKVFFSQIIKSNLDTLEKQIEESGAIFKINLSDDASEIFSIKSYIESILYNLMTNAIKYKSPLRTPEIFISSKKINDDIMITFSDNGIGIDMPIYGKHLFGLYKRFDLSVEGKGLGLHMTKSQVEALGGKISVESKINKGTTFIITLPTQ